MQKNQGFIQILGPILVLIAILGGGYIYYQQNYAKAPVVPVPTTDNSNENSFGTNYQPKPVTPAPIQPTQPIACTADAKICPDGSSVGRTGPKCEFAQCPVSKNTSGDWITYHNTSYGFKLKHPSNLTTRSNGPFKDPKITQLDSITFTNDSDQYYFFVDVFSKFNGEISLNNQLNVRKESFCSDGDWRNDYTVEDYPSTSLNVNNIPVLVSRLRVTSPQAYYSCYIFKNKSNNLIVLEGRIPTVIFGPSNQQQFDALNVILDQVISTLSLD
ncbi:MAG: hypothetical protein Q7T49_00975 [bacterium]|nr:hypothetical protein [bacterium]